MKCLTSFDKSKRDGHKSICKACRAVAYVANRDAERLKRKIHRQRDPDAYNRRFERWKTKNPDRYAAYQLAYRMANIARKSEYAKENQARRTAMQNMRRAKKINATPAWANLKIVDEFYSLAALMNKFSDQKFHVDHIVPLQNKLVCGLHNEFNLQILTARANIIKGNRVWPGMP